MGLTLRDTTVVIFGNPKGGTPVMEAVPTAALDLPLKILVWDDAGQTKVSYLDPQALAARYDIPDELAGPARGNRRAGRRVDRTHRLRPDRDMAAPTINPDREQHFPLLADDTTVEDEGMRA